MLGISAMGATPRAILYVVAVVFFVLAGLGQKLLGDKINLVGFGLAAATFVVMWDALANT